MQCLLQHLRANFIELCQSNNDNNNNNNSDDNNNKYWSGGLGVRNVSMLASSAFLASAAGTLHLQTEILRNTQTTVEDTSSSLKHGLSITDLTSEDSLPFGNQRMLDFIVVNHTFQTLLEIYSSKSPSKTFGRQSSSQWRLHACCKLFQFPHAVSD